MKIKKYIVILLFLFVGSVFPQKSFALGDFIKPDSTFYFLQSWKESMGLFFSFSKEKKLEYLDELNNKRVVEIRDYRKSDIQTVEVLAKRYENNYQEIEKLALQVKEKNQIAEKIKNNNLAQQEILAQVYKQVPEQAQSAIQNAQTNSSKNVSSVLEKISPEVAEEYAQKVEQIRQIQMNKMIEKMPMMDKESGNEGGDPESRKPKPLNEIKEGKELNQINNANDINNNIDNSEEGKSQNIIQPMQPAPMQSPASKN